MTICRSGLNTIYLCCGDILLNIVLFNGIIYVIGTDMMSKEEVGYSLLNAACNELGIYLTGGSIKLNGKVMYSVDSQRYLGSLYRFKGFGISIVNGKQLEYYIRNSV